MPIPVTCPQCGLILAAPESAAGKKAKCRNCQTVLTIPTPGLEILDDPAPPMAVPVPEPVVVPAPAAFVPSDAGSFSFDEPAAKPRKATRRNDDDEEEEDRPRRKRRREDDDDDEAEKPRSRKPVKPEKGDKTLIYVVVAAFAVLFIVGLGGFGFWYAVLKKPAVETVDTSILSKPKPSVGVVKTKPTFKEPPKEWERVEDVDFNAFMPKVGHALDKAEGRFGKIEDFPELGEVRFVGKDVSKTVDLYAIIFTIRPEHLAEVNKDPLRAISGWSDLFLIKVPGDEVTVTPFTNDEFKYKGKQYHYVDKRGPRFYFRMFVAHDKFYVLLTTGVDITERNEYVKVFFDNFQPTK